VNWQPAALPACVRVPRNYHAQFHSAPASAFGCAPAREFKELQVACVQAIKSACCKDYESFRVPEGSFFHVFTRAAASGGLESLKGQ
jgi:hypothetical protein